MTYEEIESQRQLLQAQLDREKTQEERNVKGQFSTPFALAKDVLNHASTFFPKNRKVRFLDPAVGTGVFYSALNVAFPEKQIQTALGFEIDEHYGDPAIKLWDSTSIDYRIADFTKQAPPNDDEKFNLIICNPPYVRHHHIKEEKKQLQSQAAKTANMKLSGLAGLYCYFMALAHPWMKKDAISGWLIPSEFMNVNYGQGVKDYLLNEVTLLQIHRFDPNDVQFDDALVSSAIVWFINKKPAKSHKVKFTFGGSIDDPVVKKDVSNAVLSKENKWTRFPLFEEREVTSLPKLQDFFTISRGIATGDNKFFVLDKNKIENLGLPFDQFKPILPSPRYLKVDVVESDKNGHPDIDKQLFVLDCKLPIDQIKDLHPKLYGYLKSGMEAGVSERYLCRSRKIWYSQENRPRSNFYCTYIGRTDVKGKKPFRFVLNKSKAIVANSYLILYPKPNLQSELDKRPELNEAILESLNRITSDAMLDEGRVYGGGMHKLEPKELSKVLATEIEAIFEGRLSELQSDFFAV